MCLALGRVERGGTGMQNAYGEGVRGMRTIALVLVILWASLAMAGCGDDAQSRMSNLEGLWITSPMPGTPYHSPVVGSWRSERSSDMVVTFSPDGVATTTFSTDGSLDYLPKGNYVIVGQTIKITYLSEKTSNGHTETHTTWETYRYDGATLVNVNGNGAFTRVASQGATQSP
jgi:hypothetical protein